MKLALCEQGQPLQAHDDSSASGSQVGDAMQAAREPSSLSVQLSGQSFHPCLVIPCQGSWIQLYPDALFLS